jgi:hypothetical protein
MCRKYSCEKCGTECRDAVYLRFQLTRCGLVNARHQTDRNRSIPLGHFCKGCLAAVVRTVVHNPQDPSKA